MIRAMSIDDRATWLGPVTLVGETVRLEPLRPEHAGALLEAAGSPETFRYFSDVPMPWSEEGFRQWIIRRLETEALTPFCVVHLASNRPIGVTTYLDIRPKHRGVEIGWTWLSPSQRGTRTNPEMKRFMLRHAFDEHGAIRVQLKTDLRNLQSQHAIEKLGAQREGVLRDSIVMPDGYLRSTVMYSITATEWPAVRERLDARLAAMSEAAR